MWRGGCARGWLGGAASAPAGTNADRLEAFAPNPAHGATTFEFSLRAGTNVDLGVFDIVGREVARQPGGWLTAGRHALRWDGAGTDGRKLPAGLYHARLRTPNGTAVRSLVFTP